MIPPLINCIDTDTVVSVKANCSASIVSVRQRYAPATIELLMDDMTPHIL